MKGERFIIINVHLSIRTCLHPPLDRGYDQERSHIPVAWDTPDTHHSSFVSPSRTLCNSPSPLPVCEDRQGEGVGKG